MFCKIWKSMNDKKTLSDFQLQIDTWIQTHGGYWPPLSMLAALLEELGELAREINNKEGSKPKKQDERDVFKNEDEGLHEEISDALFALICIANYYKIDLDQALRNTLKKYSTRDSNRFI